MTRGMGAVSKTDAAAPPFGATAALCPSFFVTWSSIDLPRLTMQRVRIQVVISSDRVFALLQGMGLAIPGDLHFANLDLSEPPRQAAGMDHRYQLVGIETVNLVLTQVTLSLTGVPAMPKVVLVDSHRRDGFTLPTKPVAAPISEPPRPKRFVRAESH